MSQNLEDVDFFYLKATGAVSWPIFLIMWLGCQTGLSQSEARTTCNEMGFQPLLLHTQSRGSKDPELWVTYLDGLEVQRK